MPRRLAHALLLAVPLLSGCAAVNTANLMQAEQVLLDARAAGAAQYAPYELTLAEVYLTKAREEWGDSQYEDADALATKAEEFALAAEKRAVTEATMGESAEEIVPEEVAPPPEQPPAQDPEEPDDSELLELIQEDADEERKPGVMTDEPLDIDELEDEQ